MYHGIANIAPSEWFPDISSTDISPPLIRYTVRLRRLKELLFQHRTAFVNPASMTKNLKVG